MAEQSSQRTQPAKASVQPSAAPSTTRMRPSSFKYYIHDSIAVLRFQLIGSLTQSDIAELNGSWRTAKTTLGSRKLVLDLESLRTIDEAGKQWLASMSAEGASYLPENFLVSCIAGQHASEPESDLPAQKAGLFRKLASLFRGDRVSAA
ncbi:MAG: hypothetical protein JO340_09415 [Acidobacteriaceae bacterium]|nr:hypothetical protein [Acidobacteriaceae bacterium]